MRTNPRRIAALLAAAGGTLLATSSARATITFEADGDPYISGSWSQKFTLTEDDGSSRFNYIRLQSVSGLGFETSPMAPVTGLPSGWDLILATQTKAEARTRLRESLNTMTFTVNFADPNVTSVAFKFWDWQWAPKLGGDYMWTLMKSELVTSYYDSTERKWKWTITGGDPDLAPVGSPVPEFSTYIAGLLLLVPVLVNGVRVLRRRQRM